MEVALGYITLFANGILLGGLYSLFAVGLSLIFGVMRLVNIAHGDLIIFTAYALWVGTEYLHLSPLLSFLLIVPFLFVMGYGLQRGLLNRIQGSDILPPLLVTFGLSIVIQNGLLQAFSADNRRLFLGDLDSMSIMIAPGFSLGLLPLIIFAAAIIICAALHLFFYHTPLGRTLRAVSDDHHTAELMGINTRHSFGLAMAICFVVIAVAGLFFALKTNFDPSSGPLRLLFAFEAVIIGGLGNLWGTLIGGILLGLGQAIGSAIHPGLQVLSAHVVFLLVLLFRPQGLMPRTR